MAQILTWRKKVLSFLYRCGRSVRRKVASLLHLNRLFFHVAFLSNSILCLATPPLRVGWWSQIPYGSNQSSFCQVSVYVREEVICTVWQYDSSLKSFYSSSSSCNEKRSLASVICQTGRAENEAYFLTAVVTSFCVINELVIQAPKTLTFLLQQQLFIM